MGDPTVPTPRRGGRIIWGWIIAFAFAAMTFAFYRFEPILRPYDPWFLDQVEGRNLETLSIRGTLAEGRLRRPSVVRDAQGREEVVAGWFATEIPSTDDAPPLLGRLRSQDEPVAIRWEDGPGVGLGADGYVASILAVALLVPAAMAGSTLGYLLGRLRARAPRGPDDGGVSQSTSSVAPPTP